MQRYYFDHNATTPVAPEVRDAVWPLFGEIFGNASSIHHYGQAAKQRLETARRQVAAALGCEPGEIVFTSGGTEADNLALFGVVRASKRADRHAITTAIEHPAVLAACAKLESEGAAVTRVSVGASGVVDPGEIRRALRPGTLMVSVMHANNELGTLQPVADIAAICREAGVLLHSDGVQAFGKAALNVRELGVDFYSISGHKIGAPKGIGALYARKGVEFEPLIYGGRHEQGRRAGTENVPLAVGLGCAAAMLADSGELARMAALRDWLEDGILARIPWARVNCADSPRLPNTSNVLFDGIEGEAMVIALDLEGFAVSSGAACSSGALEPSPCLTATGLSRADARSCVRFSLGPSNGASQVDALIEAVASSAARLRRLSPVVSHA